MQCSLVGLGKCGTRKCQPGLHENRLRSWNKICFFGKLSNCKIRQLCKFPKDIDAPGRIASSLHETIKPNNDLHERLFAKFRNWIKAPHSGEHFTAGICHSLQTSLWLNCEEMTQQMIWRRIKTKKSSRMVFVDEWNESKFSIKNWAYSWKLMRFA